MKLTKNQVDELVKILESGKWQSRRHVITLNNDFSIWSGSGWMSYEPYPDNGASFSLLEKLKLRKAIKIGWLSKAVGSKK